MPARPRPAQQRIATPASLRAALLIAATIALLQAAQVQAQSNPAAAADFEVSATIVKGCRINSLSGHGNLGQIGTINFGSHASLNESAHTAPLTLTQSLTMRCTPLTPLTVQISLGQHPLDNARRMQISGGTNYLSYKLCTQAACSPADIVTSASRSITAPVQAQNITLSYFGSVTVPAGTPSGVYSDELLVTYAW